LSIYTPAQSLRLILVYIVTCSFSTLVTANHEPINLDWQSQSVTTTNYCSGYYLPYQPQAVNQNFAPNQQLLYSNADSSEYQQGITHLKGNVELRQGEQQITGDQASFNNNESYVEIVGHVTFRSPNIVAHSDDLSFNMADSSAQLNHAQLALPDSELRANAQSIDYHSDDTVTMNKGSFTFCPPSNNAWAIHSKKIDLDPNAGFGVAQNAILKIGVVPVFYLPWISFPIDNQRRSGFLFPTLGSSSQMGLDITTPYYLNIAPNYDALITPRFTELRGTSIGTKLRHMGHQSEQDLYVNWAIDDPDSTQNRWLIEYNNNTKISANLSSSVHIKRVSDSELFNDYGLSQTSSEKSAIVSNAKINYQGQAPLLNKASLAVITHQNLTTGVPAYDQLPHATLSGGMTLNQEQQAIGATYTVDLSRFTRDSENLTGSNRVTGTRTHLVPSINTSWVNEYSFFKPKISLPITHYLLSDTPSTIASAKTRIIPQLEIDSGLLFQRDLLNGYRQTLEPRLYYAYVPYQQQDDVAIFDTSAKSKPFYQPNRFSGYDRIGDTNRITLGLDSQFLSAKGWQKAKLSITQIHYLSDRKVQLSSASAPSTETFTPIYGHINYQFTPYWSSSVNIDWSPKSGNVEATSATMKYQINNNKIIDIKYTETLNSTQQGEVSLIWPIAPQWTFIAKHKEDLRNQQLQDEILGIEYANCCWKGRLVSRNWLVDQTKGMEHGLFFELSLKGLGGSDKQLTSGNRVRMADFMKGITGYNEYTQ
jgi:LPS-assembly protein